MRSPTAVHKMKDNIVHSDVRCQDYHKDLLIQLAIYPVSTYSVVETAKEEENEVRSRTIGTNIQLAAGFSLAD